MGLAQAQPKVAAAAIMTDFMMARRVEIMSV